MTWIDTAIDNYYTFLKENTEVLQDSQTGWFVISTPFVGLFNDTVEIFCKENDGVITLSDDKQTIHNIELVGVPIQRSAKRKEIVQRILLNYGIRLEDGELLVEANLKNFPQKKHNLLSAIIEISDMYMLSKQTITSVFKEDVKKYLDEQDIIYTPQFISKGSMGIEFNFDFQIARRDREIVINTFNSLNVANLSKFILGWDDIKETRERITQKKLIGLAVVNNDDKEIKEEYLEALRIKGTDYILWTERHKPENLKKVIAA